MYCHSFMPWKQVSEFGLGYSYPDSFECLVKGDKANVDVSNTFGYFKD